MQCKQMKYNINAMKLSGISFSKNFQLVESRDLEFPRWLSRRRQWHPTPVLLRGKSHGWRSLVGYSPWARKELYMTENTYFHLFILVTVGLHPQVCKLYMKAGIFFLIYSLLHFQYLEQCLAGSRYSINICWQMNK